MFVQLSLLLVAGETVNDKTTKGRYGAILISSAEILPGTFYKKTQELSEG